VVLSIGRTAESKSALDLTTSCWGKSLGRWEVCDDHRLEDSEDLCEARTTDMRKQINWLSVIVSEELEMTVFEGNLFLFCNKHRRILKIIYWETNGFCQWLKRP